MSRFRAHVVGSLLRPRYLRDAQARHRAGTIAEEEFRRIENRAVDEAIALQEAAGIDLVTDGEQRRFIFMDALLAAVHGITPVETGATADRIHWHGERPAGFVDFSAVTRRMVITGRLGRRRGLAVDEFIHARDRATRPVKAALPTPMCVLAYWSDEHARAVYEHPLEAVTDAAEFLKEEIALLAGAGCRHVQIDAPDLTLLVDPAAAGMYEAVGFTKDAYLSEAAAQLQGVAAEPGVAHLPRQQPGPVARAGRLRGHLQRAVPATEQLRVLPARIRRRALRHLRAVAGRP
jgi:5-methyltetrahydropteroyltriglutamate--homocysteine methyltransferase